MATILVPTTSLKSALTRKSLLAALDKRTGFARVDVLFTDIYGRKPVYSVMNKVSELHQFIDDCEELCIATKSLALEGDIPRAAVMVSWRNKSRVFGEMDAKQQEGIFPKAELPADVRPKNRTRKPKEGAPPKEEKDTKDWMPGIALVEPEWFNRDAAAELMLKEYQYALTSVGEVDVAFSNIGLGRATVKYCKPSSEGGFLVTIQVPAPRVAAEEAAEDDGEGSDGSEIPAE